MLHRRVSARLAAVLVCGLLLLSVAPVAAHDHEVPSPRLFRGDDRIQRPRILHSCWVFPLGEYQATDCTEYPWSFPKRDRVRAGRVLTVRLRKQQRPEALGLSSYSSLKGDGSPAGAAQRITTVLEPNVDQDGTIVGYWVKFSLTPGRHFLILKARWPDENEPELKQSAEWTMNLRARS